MTELSIGETRGRSSGEKSVFNKLLLHICCSPCLVYPYSIITEGGLFQNIVGYFYNPNIHPYSEYKRREESLEKFSSESGLKVIYEKEYGMEEFIRNVAFREENRCYYCLGNRLEKTAALARSSKFTHFSTTLLYSIHQKHEFIKETGMSLQKKYGVEFYYENFREGYKKGIELSLERGMYRQNYCGCIYSEKDRFFRKPNRLSHK